MIGQSITPIVQGTISRSNHGGNQRRFYNFPRERGNGADVRRGEERVGLGVRGKGWVPEPLPPQVQVRAALIWAQILSSRWTGKGTSYSMSIKEGIRVVRR